MDNQKTKPPKNFRHIEVRCCATCKDFYFDNGAAMCNRTDEDGNEWCVGDATSLDHYAHVCNYYKSRRVAWIKQQVAEIGD